MQRLVYILAASHSGSTLLAMLLGAHKEACSVGELKLTNLGSIDRYRCSCGKPIRKCEFWSSVHDRMLERGINFDLGNAGTSIHSVTNPYVAMLLKKLHRGLFVEMVRDFALSLAPSWSKHLHDVQTRNSALIATLQEISGAKVVVDSSKIGLRLKYLLRNKDLDVRVIRQIRDGRAVALTYVDPLSFADASNPELRAGGFGGNRADEERSISEAAHEWRRSNEEAECVLATMDRSHWTEIRYEQLCTDPQATLEKLCEFLGLSKSGIVRDYRSRIQHIIGNGMRLDTTSEICLDDRWKTQLTASQLKLFDAEAGTLNRKYGYV